MKIAFVTTEFFPLTGESPLGRTSREIPAALARRGHDVTVWLPAYSPVLESDHLFEDLEFMLPVTVPLGSERENIGLCEWIDPGSGFRVVIVDHPACFRRAGLDQDPKTGEDYTDNDRRWILFQRAVLEGMKAMDFRPDVFHLNDYRTGLVPTYLKTLYREDHFFDGSASVFTIHNLGQQGIYPAEVLNLAGLPMDLFYPTGPLEFWGRVNFMKSAIMFSDFLTTLSPTHAAEIQAREEYGFGLEGVLRSRTFELTGILNGIDTDAWDPSTDAHLPSHYSEHDLFGKTECREAFLAKVGFTGGSSGPVLLIPGTSVDHRAADLLSEASAEIFRLGFRIVATGSVSEHWRDLARDLESRHPGEMVFLPGSDESLEHLAMASCDFSLVASRHETDCPSPLISQRYGTLPVVCEAGCTADMVIPFDLETGEGTGFSFKDYNRNGLVSTLRVALGVFRDPARLKAIQARSMAKDSSWDRTASACEEIYLKALQRQSSERTDSGV